MLPRSKSHGKMHQIQSFLQTRSSLHQRLILVSVVLLLISGVILLHSVVFSQHQQTTGGTSNTPAVSFASEKDDKAAATATGPAKQMIDLTPPLSRSTLGHSAWSVLHTIAALFPEDPSQEKQEAMVTLLTSLAELYPCATCARHFRAYLQAHPIPMPMTRRSISTYLCESHNSVNVRLEKPIVSCANIEATWPSRLEEDCGCAAADSPSLDPKAPEAEKKSGSDESAPDAAATSAASGLTTAAAASATPTTPQMRERSAAPHASVEKLKATSRSSLPAAGSAAAATAKKERIAAEEAADQRREKEKEQLRKDRERVATLRS